MTIKVAINGFGRVGRILMRLAGDNYWDDIEVVAINTRAGSKTLAHLLKYDSNFGTYNKSVEATENSIIVDGREVKTFTEEDPTNLPYKDLGVDIVVDTSGVFLKRDKAMSHINAGAKKVILTAPAKDDDITTIVMGVNEDIYDPKKDLIISNASCTTNCLAPVAKVLDEKFGIVKGLMTTVHSYTNDQRILDKTHKDFRRARSAATSIIPTTTGAAKAVGKVLPNLEGKLNGFALRVPTPTVSITDLVCEMASSVTAEAINDVLREASEGELKGILGFCDEPLVSVDYKGDCRSSIVDSLLTMVIGGNMAKVVAWYDNEWGYTCRVADLVKYVADRL